MKLFLRPSSTKRSPLGMALIGCFLGLMLVLAACGSNPSTTTTGSGSTSTPSGSPTVTPPTDLLVSGTLTVGSDTTYPPQEYIDTTTNQPAGFDVDLITAIAQRMGLKAHVVTANFDTIIDSLNAKRFDVVISAVTITPARQQKADFIPYFNAGESLLVQNGNPAHITQLSDLCGQNAGAQNGTIEQSDLQTASKACQTSGKKPINITVLTDETDVIQLLATNRVVATYQDSPVTDYYIKQHPGQFQVGGSVINAAPEGIVVRKGDTSMFNAINTAFQQMRTDGSYHALIEKWGLADEELTSMIDRRSALA